MQCETVRGRSCPNYARTATPPAEVIPMVLHCPYCHTQHLDKGEWATKAHTSHRCHVCRAIWRPTTVPTVGVESVPPGRHDRPPMRATPPAEAREPATEELKPCPFCGGEGINCSASESRKNGDLEWSVFCRDCECYFDSAEEATKAWNTRATPAPALVERATGIETAVGGVYEMPDGRNFWLDGPVAREITRRVMRVIAMPSRERLREQIAGDADIPAEAGAEAAPVSEIIARVKSTREKLVDYAVHFGARDEVSKLFVAAALDHAEATSTLLAALPGAATEVLKCEWPNCGCPTAAHCTATEERP